MIGCLSACMAKINSEDPSINCCSGKYNSKEACHFGEVDYYQVLKPYCQNAYWYRRSPSSSQTSSHPSERSNRPTCLQLMTFNRIVLRSIGVVQRVKTQTISSRSVLMGRLQRMEIPSTKEELLSLEKRESKLVLVKTGIRRR